MTLLEMLLEVMDMEVVDDEKEDKKVVEYSKRADHVDMLHDYDYIEKRLQITVLFFHSVVGMF